jgi:hypothetical protein
MTVASLTLTIMDVLERSGKLANICHATVTVTLPKPKKYCNIINRFFRKIRKFSQKFANFRKNSQTFAKIRKLSQKFANFANFRNVLILAKKIRKKDYIFIRITVVEKYGNTFETNLRKNPQTQRAKN